jgi:hypothetical protein
VVFAGAVWPVAEVDGLAAGLAAGAAGLAAGAAGFLACAPATIGKGKNTAKSAMAIRGDVPLTLMQLIIFSSTSAEAATSRSRNLKGLLDVAYLIVHKNDLHVLVNKSLLLTQIDHLLWHAHRL